MVHKFRQIVHRGLIKLLGADLTARLDINSPERKLDANGIDKYMPQGALHAEHPEQISDR